MAFSPNDMLARYLQAVGFWLPRSQKNDILAELSEDLRSQMEDREAELGHPLDEAEVSALLKRRGRPILVAGRFLPQQHLIGPALFPIYVLVLKIAALCYLVPWLLVWIGLLIFDHSGHPHPLGNLWTIAFTQFGIITIVFAVLDRASTHARLVDDWDPQKLPKVKPQQSTARSCNAIAGIVFGFLGLVWLFIVPRFPFLILGPAAYMLNPAPIWQSVYGLFIVLAFAGIFENVVLLLRPRLMWFQPVYRIATSSLCLWVAYLLLQTRTYFVPVNQQAAQAAAIGNLIVLIGIAGTAFGMTIGLFFHAWQAIQAVRRSLHPATASLA